MPEVDEIHILHHSNESPRTVISALWKVNWTTSFPVLKSSVPRPGMKGLESADLLLN